MELSRALVNTLKSRRFWIWQIAGVIIYGLPVAYRFATKSVAIPLLNFPGFWIDHYIPGNMLEKILVNAFFPGGAGGVAGEVLVSNYRNRAIEGKNKYFSRLGGALFQTTLWSAFQYWGYSLMIFGPWSIGDGWGNIFEHWMVFPFNFTLAAFSVFTPDVVNFTRSILLKAYGKFPVKSSKG
jgi:hypothetical protein